MSNIDKRALREEAIRAGGVKWQYMRATQHSKAYITDETGSTVINCTDGDVPAKCAGFLTSANPATVLALLDELDIANGYSSAYEAEKWHYHGLAESEGERADRAEKALEAAEKRIAELEALAKSVKFDPIPMEELGNKSDGKKHPYMFGAGYNSAVVHCESVMLKAFASAGIGSQPVSHRDELPQEEIECDICGHVSTDPEGRHHCCEDNSND